MLGTQNGTDRGMSTVAGFASARLDRLTDPALATIDPETRAAPLWEAMTIALHDIASIVMFRYNNVWATGAGVRCEARADDLALAPLVAP